MKQYTVLDPDTQRHLSEIHHADLLVAVISRNNADSVRKTMEAAVDGVFTHYSHLKPVLIQVDQNSDDRSSQILSEIAVPRKMEKICIRSEAESIWTGPMQTILEMARTLWVKAAIVISPTDISVPLLCADDIHGLAEPILEQGMTLAIPQHPYTSEAVLINDLLVAPVVGALFSCPISNFLTSRLAFAGTLAHQLLGEEMWLYVDGDGRFDTWMGAQALHRGFTLAPTLLAGEAPSLQPFQNRMQVVAREAMDTLFFLTERFSDRLNLPDQEVGFKESLSLTRPEFPAAPADAISQCKAQADALLGTHTNEMARHFSAPELELFACITRGKGNDANSWAAALAACLAARHRNPQSRVIIMEIAVALFLSHVAGRLESRAGKPEATPCFLEDAWKAMRALRPQLAKAHR